VQRANYGVRVTGNVDRSQDPLTLAGWGRRILAVFIDWFIALLTVSVLTGQRLFGSTDSNPWLPLIVFWFEATLLTGLLGFTIGKRLLGLRVVGTDGRPIGLLRAALRTALLCLVIPAVIQYRDRRGLHDAAARSVVTRIAAST